jgi:hypothetical protein
MIAGPRRRKIERMSGIFSIITDQRKKCNGFPDFARPDLPVYAGFNKFSLTSREKYPIMISGPSGAHIGRAERNPAI